MGELTRYVITYYPHLMTEAEAKARKAPIGEKKVQTTDSPELQAVGRKFWVSDEPAVRELLKEGEERLLLHIRDRIIREHAGQVFLNYCPGCGSPANTPRAKQCPKCFLSWHDGEENEQT